jgi:hypothetical protein
MDQFHFEVHRRAWLDQEWTSRNETARTDIGSLKRSGLRLTASGDTDNAKWQPQIGARVTPALIRKGRFIRREMLHAWRRNPTAQGGLIK